MNKRFSKTLAISLIGVISWISMSMVIGTYKIGAKMSLYQDPHAAKYSQIDLLH